MVASHAALWLYVVLVSLLTGGALFERLVLVPAWTSSLPLSVRNWNSAPGIIIDQTRFFRWVSPPLMLVSPYLLWIALKDDGVERNPLLLSSVTIIVVLVVTIAYYARVLHRLTLKRGDGMSDEQIVRAAHMWVNLQYVRLALVVVAWISALVALTRVR